MAGSHEDRAGDHETHIPDHTAEQAGRNRQNNVKRKEQRRKAKRMAHEAALSGFAHTHQQPHKRHRQMGIEQTTEWAMLQAQRWLDNEKRKLDRGDGYDWSPSEYCENANVVIQRFLEEMKAAKQARGKTSNLADWWKLHQSRTKIKKKERWAAKKVARSKAEKDVRSGVGASGSAPSRMDVDQGEHDLMAEGIHNASGAIGPVSAGHLDISINKEKGMYNHVGGSEVEMSEEPNLALRMQGMKIEGANGRDWHGKAPDPVAPQIFDDLGDPDADMLDMAPEPV
ncbi:MAG: hypothetical protein Q9169_005692 [Polycauliona sp. 2 TL-2023]